MLQQPSTHDLAQGGGFWTQGLLLLSCPASDPLAVHREVALAGTGSVEMVRWFISEVCALQARASCSSGLQSGSPDMDLHVPATGEEAIP